MIKTGVKFMLTLFKSDDFDVSAHTAGAEPSAVMSEVRVMKREEGLAFKEAIPFDVKNANHRAAFAYFEANRKWHPSAPRFIKELSYISMHAMMSAKLLEYYISRDREVAKIKNA